MGIDVTADKDVLFNNTHQRLVNTSVESNPHVRMLDGLTIHSIFRRRKSRHGEGDGNPLIYALKQKNGYSISQEEILKFSPNFKAILEKVVADRSGAVVVPMPSSHPIARMVAARVVRSMPAAKLCEGLFAKKTAGEVSAELSGLLDAGDVKKSIHSEVKGLIRELGRSGEQPFAMKNVGPRLRPYIRPIKLQAEISGQEPILLVDDLLSSGATLLGARDLLAASRVGVEIEALCLLSSL